MAKDYTFQIVNDDVTQEELDFIKNDQSSSDNYWKIRSKVYHGPNMEVCQSSVFWDLKKEDSLRAAMFDSFDLWDDEDLMTTIIMTSRGIKQTFKTRVVTQDKIDVFKLKYQQWENNPNKGDTATTPKEEVFKFLDDNKGKRMFIYC